MSTRLVLIHAYSPLHAGTGQAAGAIDLPIARERPTGIPIVPGSSVKGALRARSAERETAARTADPETPLAGPSTNVIFGPETKDKEQSDYAGAAQFSDVRLVLLPVRSLAGTFAWTTSPYLLSRFARDAAEAGFSSLGEAPAPPPQESCSVLGTRLSMQVAGKARVVIEDLDFLAAKEPEGSRLAVFAKHLGEWLFPGTAGADTTARADLAARLCLVDDDTMSFLLETATEVAARVRLDEETKTVRRGALWTEEALPAESVLSGLAVAGRVKRNGDTWSPEQILDRIAGLADRLVQLGGKANVGRGSCRVRLAPAPAAAGGRP